MSLQIIILNTNSQLDGSFSVSGVFWLTAPINNIVPLPNFQSQVPFIDSNNLLSLQYGNIVEQTFNSGLFISGTILSDVQTSLQSQFNDAQQALNSINSPISNLIGRVFDGYTSSWNSSNPFVSVSKVKISPQYTQRSYNWTGWKAVQTAKGGIHQYDDNGTVYTIWFYDGPEAHICNIWKSTVPNNVVSGGYSQNQNNADKTDFETNFKSTGNALLVPHALDGRPNIRTTTASKTHNFNLKVFSFVPGDHTKLINKAADFTDAGDVTMICYDVNGNVTTNQSSAVKTVLDWEPTYNYEIIGGWMDIPSGIAGGTQGQWYFQVVGVPDVPSYMGGTIPFIYPTDMALIYSAQIVSNGRASQYLTYNATYHTNKLRWIMRHPANVGGLFGGSTPWMQVYMETFTG